MLQIVLGTKTGSSARLYITKPVVAYQRETQKGQGGDRAQVLEQPGGMKKHGGDEADRIRTQSGRAKDWKGSLY